MGRRLRGAAKAIAWSMLFMLALAASALLHLPTLRGRRVAARSLSTYISSQMAGRLVIGRIDVLGPDRVVVHHAALFDPAGRRVLTGDEVVIVPDIHAAWEGALRFHSATLRGGSLRLIEGANGLPTFLEAFAPALPAAPDRGPGLHALVDRIELEDVTAYGDLLGLSGLRLEGLAARGRLEILGDVRIRIDSASGRLVRPYQTPMRLERVVARVRGDPNLGTRLYADVTMPGQRVEANMTYAADANAAPPAGGDAPEMRLDLLLHAEPIRASTVEDVGLSFASALGGEFRGYLRLTGPPDNLRMRASLETEGGPVTATGSLPANAPFDVQLRTTGLDLAPVVPGAPAVEVAGGLRLHGGESAADPTRLELQVEAFDAFGMALPAFEVTGRLDDTGLHVDSAHANASGGVLDASGHVSFDGVTDLRVRARLSHVARDPSLRTLMPGAHGGLRADVRLHGSPENLRASGRLRMAPFVWGPLRADYVEVSGSLLGVTSHPSGRAELRAGGVDLAGYPIGTGQATLHGGPVHWETRAHFAAAEDRELSFDAAVEVGRRDLRVSSPSFRVRRGEVAYDGSVQDLVYRPGRGLSASRVTFARGAQRLVLSGEWRTRGDDDLRALATAVDVHALRQLLPFSTPEASGTLSGDLQISGDLDRSPVVHFSGHLQDGALAALTQVAGEMVLDYHAGALESRGRVVVGGGGALSFDGTGVLEDVSLSQLLDTWRDGYYEAHLAGSELDLAGFAPLWPTVMPGLDGHVDLELAFTGMVDAPSFRGSLHSEDLAPAGWPALGAETQFEYERGVLDARAIVRDHDGTLVEGEFNFLADLASLLAEPELAAELLSIAPWRVSLRVPPRVVARLPAPLHEALGESFDPISFSLSATLAGGSLPTRGDITGNLSWMGDFSELPCGNRAAPRALFEATLSAGELHATARLFSQATRVADLRANAAMPVDDWLASGEMPQIPPLHLEARVTDIALAELPHICEHVGGRVSATLLAEDILGASPEVHVALDSPALTARRFEPVSARRRHAGLQEETPPVSLEARADLSDGASSFDASANFWNGGTLHTAGAVSTPWAAGEVFPALGDEALRVDTELAGAPLEALLSFVSGIEHVSGLVDGRVSVSGSMTDPQLAGSLELSRGSLDIVGMGQRLERGRGDFLLAGDRVLLRDVSVSDGEGRAQISGEIQLDALRPEKASLRLTADAFPVRQEGSVLATLDGHASLDVDILPERIQGELVIGDLTVLLSESSSRSTQALSPHPDIVVVGERFTRAAELSPYPIRLDVRAPTPFWVRGQNFSARVTANLNVQYTDPSFRVAGEMEIDRGFFEVFGKRFEVRQGAMGFDGGAELDPLVQLVAVHTLRDQSGATVTVTASGRLSRPAITFRTTVDGCGDEGQIIALLVSGSCQLLDHGNQTATDGGTQAAEFLQGLAFGVLTLSLREELGEYFPVIVVESGQRGIGGTRIRAGFDARDLLPDVVRRVITGAYVEGSVDIAGANPDGSQRQAADVGFLMELRFPHDIVTTGRISINRNWSLDLTWEP